MKNKLKIEYSAVFNYENSAKNATGQWTDTSDQDDQRVKAGSEKHCVQGDIQGDYDN